MCAKLHRPLFKKHLCTKRTGGTASKRIVYAGYGLQNLVGKIVPAVNNVGVDEKLKRTLYVSGQNREIRRGGSLIFL